MASSTSELKTYYGNCHCGAFKYSVELPELTSVIECDCSICHRKGYKWVFPGAGCFTIEKDEGKLKDYEFGARKMTHKFCSVCGTGVYGMRHNAPPGMDMGLNVRTLRGINLWSIPVGHTYNGAALKPQYTPPKYEGPEPDATLMDAKIYNGACHCGAVTMALKIHDSLEDGHEKIMECDCSICARNGEIFIYPTSPLQLQILNSASLTSYIFGRKIQSHEFCPVCGVSVYIQKFDIPAETFQKWEGVAGSGEKEKQEKWKESVPVNLRCFEGVEWDKVKIEKHSMKDAEPIYKV